VRDMDLSVVLEGPATEIASIQVFASDGSGDAQGDASFTTAGVEPTDDGFVAVRVGNAGPYTQTRGEPLLATKDAKTTLDLAMSNEDDAFFNGAVFTVAVEKAGGQPSKRTFTVFGK